jgi:acyl-CoA synthetase (AMP-forming)/AMP-acid ligase II
LVSETARCSFGELDGRANSLANALLAGGVRAGDRVAILADNCSEYAEVLAAVAKGGFVVVPLSCRLEPEDLAYMINNSEAGTLFLGGNYWQVINSLQPRLESVRRFIVFGDASGERGSYEGLIRTHPAEEPRLGVAEGDLYCIAYTSGTTGLPKGVMLSHRNIVSALTDGAITFGLTRDDVVAVYHPLFHISSIWSLWLSLYVGAGCVILERFDPKLFLETVQQERITALGLASPLIAPLLKHPDIRKYDLGSLRAIIYGGAPMPLDALREGVEVLGNCLYGTYSMTETVGPATVLFPQEHVFQGPEERLKRLRSCGRETLNTEVRVVDEEGCDITPGEVGELIVRSDSVTMGYWKQPLATAEALREGYLHTGDLATVDEEGYLYTFDRKKDTIVTGGKKVSSREVEEVLYLHPSVQEAAVIGVPHREMGEAIKAVVVLKKRKKVTPEEIILLCQKNLPRHACPLEVHFVDSLPRNPLGKVLKRALRAKDGSL